MQGDSRDHPVKTRHRSDTALNAPRTAATFGLRDPRVVGSSPAAAAEAARAHVHQAYGRRHASAAVSHDGDLAQPQGELQALGPTDFPADNDQAR